MAALSLIENCVIAFDNKIGGATVTAGAEVAAMPATKVQTRQLWDKFRTGTLDASLTWVRGVWATSFPVKTIAVLSGEWTVLAQVRITCSFLGAEKYNSGWYDIVPELVPFEDRQWERPNFWSGKPTNEEYSRYPKNIFKIFDKLLVVDEVKIEISDTSSARAEGIDIGRIFVGDGFQPTYNIEWGMEQAQEPISYTAMSRSGNVQTEEYTQRRAVKANLKWLSDGEAGIFHDMTRVLRSSGELVWVPNPADPAFTLRHSFVGTFDQQMPLLNRGPYVGNTTADFSIREYL